MGLNPNIPFMALQGSGRPQASPMAMLSDVMRLKVMKQAVDKGEREEQAERAMREILAQHPDSLDDGLTEMARRGYAPEALSIAEQVGKSRKAEVEFAIKQLELVTAEMDRAGQLAQAATGPGPAYDAFRGYVLERLPRLEGLVTPGYSPESVQQFQAMRQSAATYAQVQRESLERILKGDWQGGIGIALGAAPNQEAWTGVLEGARTLGAPPWILDLYPKEWSPPAQAQAMKTAIHPKDQLTIAGQEAARQETHRSNLVDEATRRYQAETARMNANRPRGTGAGGAGSGGGQSDIDAIVTAIVEGRQPPELRGLYSKSAAVRAGLERKGYDLARATLDWEAAVRLFRSGNNPQALRIRTAAETAYHSLDIIDELAGQWKGGRFPALNRVNLRAAVNGLYGKEVASVAQRLEAQISDLTSELANVYMGGNSPTDHSMELAAKNLSADWDEKVLKDLTELARKNLRIRLNSIYNLPAVGPSQDNPYDNRTPPPAGPITVPYRGTDGTSKTATFPTAEAAAEFKRRMGIQ